MSLGLRVYSHIIWQPEELNRKLQLSKSGVTSCVASWWNEFVIDTKLTHSNHFAQNLTMEQKKFRRFESAQSK